MSDDERNFPWLEGIEAARQGDDPRLCPYPPGRDRDAWNRGYRWELGPLDGG